MTLTTPRPGNAPCSIALIDTLAQSLMASSGKRSVQPRTMTPRLALRILICTTMHLIQKNQHFGWPI